VLAAEAAPVPAFPVSYSVPYPERLSRWKTALRPIMVLPHLTVLALLQQLAGLLGLVAWLCIVFTGEYDRTLWNLSAWVQRWAARVLAYVALLRDEYPPFGDKDYPAQLVIPYLRRRSRAKAAFRAVLVVPQFVVIYALSTAWWAGIVIAWVAILITGKYPEGIWRLELGLSRWLLRVLAYALLLYDEYPPFSLGLHEASPPPPDESSFWSAANQSLDFAAVLPTGPNATEEAAAFAPIPWWRPPAALDAAEKPHRDHASTPFASDPDL
jgi:hypothetical protein